MNRLEEAIRLIECILNGEDRVDDALNTLTDYIFYVVEKGLVTITDAQHQSLYGLLYELENLDFGNFGNRYVLEKYLEEVNAMVPEDMSPAINVDVVDKERDYVVPSKGFIDVDKIKAFLSKYVENRKTPWNNVKDVYGKSTCFTHDGILCFFRTIHGINHVIILDLKSEVVIAATGDYGKNMKDGFNWYVKLLYSIFMGDKFNSHRKKITNDETGQLSPDLVIREKIIGWLYEKGITDTPTAYDANKDSTTISFGRELDKDLLKKLPALFGFIIDLDIKDIFSEGYFVFDTYEGYDVSIYTDKLIINKIL